MCQLVYTIFEGDDLIWARNYPNQTKESLTEDLRNTYNNIKDKKEISNIEYVEGQKLKFINKETETHIMQVTGGDNNESNL